MSATGGNARIFWGAAITVAVLDVVTKYLAVKHLVLYQPHEVLGDVVRLTLAYNRGAAFGMSVGRASPYVFSAFAIIVLVVMWQMFRASAPHERLKVLALALASGGAVGNLIDRVRSARGVVDFIDIGVGSTRFWTFNIADSAVTVGAILLAWVLMQEEREQKRAARE